jgi:hypothetical protein
MTANQMADRLDQELDRVSSFGSPGYEDFDYSDILTKAQHFYVKKYYDELNNRKGAGLQEIEIRNQGLAALITDASSLTVSASQVGILTNGTFFDLPSNHMYTIFEECEIDKIECGTEIPIKATVMHISHNEIQRYEWSKYKKPFYKSYGKARVWRSEFNRSVSGINPANAATAKRHEIITDGTFTVTNYHMRYLKNPENIVVNRTTPANQRNSELDESTHQVIVDIAADMLMQIVKEQKAQLIEPLKELE